MTKGGKLDEELFEGATINTPSMLCVEDYLQALDWVERLGGWKKLKERSDDSLRTLTDWEGKTDWVQFLCPDKSVRSNTGVTFKIVDPRVIALDEAGQRDFIKKMIKRLESENACYDAVDR
jgi:phosphoserine aminotransferase